MGFLNESGLFPASDLEAICWFYRMHGYVLVRGLLTPDLLSRMERECLDLQRKASAGLLPDRHLSRTFPSELDVRANHVWYISELSEAVHTAATSQSLRTIMKSLLGPDCWPGFLGVGGRGVKYQDAHPGRTSLYSRIGWHTDWQAAPSLDIYPKAAFTFHLDATSPQNGFLRVVPGSHQWATPVPHTNINDTPIPQSARLSGGYTNTPPPFPMPLGFEKVRGEVAAYAEAGDTIIHDGFLWHAAARATDDDARRRHIRGSYFSGSIPDLQAAAESIKTAAY